MSFPGFKPSLYGTAVSVANHYTGLATSINFPDVYIRLSEIRSFLCNDIHKIIPKALECNKRILTMFAKDLIISEDLLLHPTPKKTSHSRVYEENGGILEQIA
ncbi:hypothetical protein TNCV_3231501 [Trichonephila clavipes]|nr:hypothetical protein TNCV_3231501 [Trichonephila clavipes]